MGLDMNLSRLDKKYDLSFESLLENEQEFMYWRRFYELDELLLNSMDDVCDCVEYNSYHVIRKEVAEAVLYEVTKGNYTELTMQVECVFNDIVKHFDFDKYYLIYSKSS